MSHLDLTRLPAHVAIIMDGNGRWAKQRNLSRTQGHIEGVKRVEEIVDYAGEIGLKVLTLYTFSTENWSRPETEVNMLMNTIVSVINHKIEKLKRDNIRFQTIGSKDRIPESVLKALSKMKEATASNTGLVMNLAFNYGSRVEMLDAIRTLANEVKTGTISADDIDEKSFSAALYTNGLPDPDLLIRTSGEKRISNFLLWQLSYAELYFTDTYWPEFTKEQFEEALLDYQHRERRFGKVGSKQ